MRFFSRSRTLKSRPDNDLPRERVAGGHARREAGAVRDEGVTRAPRGVERVRSHLPTDWACGVNGIRRRQDGGRVAAELVRGPLSHAQRERTRNGKAAAPRASHEIVPAPLPNFPTPALPRSAAAQEAFAGHAAPPGAAADRREDAGGESVPTHCTHGEDWRGRREQRVGGLRGHAARCQQRRSGAQSAHHFARSSTAGLRAA